MRYFFLFCATWPLLAQWQGENPRFDDLKGAHLKFPDLAATQQNFLNMGAAYEVLFGTVDPANGRDLFLAADDVVRHAFHNQSWSFVPKFNSELRAKFKKDPTFVVNHPFFANLLHANQILLEIARIRDPQKRLERLKKAYPHQAEHLPTILALGETYWALGDTQRGDQFLHRALELEPVEALWPMLIAKARMLRRTKSQPEAIKLLQKAVKFHFAADNPAQQLILKWQKETQNYLEAKDVQAHNQIHATGLLKRLAKQGDANAMRYYAAHFSNLTGYAKALRLLKKHIKRHANDGEALVLYLNTPGGIAEAKLNELVKQAKRLKAKGRPKAQALLIMSYTPGLPLEESIAYLQQAVEEDPSYEPVWRRLLKQLRFRGGEASFTQAEADYWQVFPQPGSLAYLITQRAGLNRAVPTDLLERACRQFPKDPEIANALAQAGRNFPEHGQLEKLVFYVLETVLHMAGKMDLRDAAQLVNKVQPLVAKKAAFNLFTANLFYEAGDFQSAEAFYEQACMDFPNQASVFELYGDVFFVMNKGKKARKAYNQALTLGFNQRTRAKIAELDALPASAFAGNARFTTPYSYTTHHFTSSGFNRIKADSKSGGVLLRMQRPYACYSYRGEPTGPLAYWSGRGGEGVSCLNDSAPLLQPLRQKFATWQKTYGCKP